MANMKEVRASENFDGVSLRALAKRTRDAGQLRWLLALVEIYDGGSRGDAPRIGGVGMQTVRDWVLRFNARRPDGLIDAKHPGPMLKLNAAHRAALARLVEDGPILAVHGAVRWRLKDLAACIQEEFEISLDRDDGGSDPARHGLSQAVRPAAPSCPGRASRRGL